MEVAVIVTAVLLVAVFGVCMWLDLKNEHKKTREALYATELATSKLAETAAELTILLDNTKRTMQEVAEMESRLAKKDDARELTRRLLEGQKGGWRDV